jgi:3'-5' exoribonuclease
MKRQYVNALEEGDFVNDYFVATRKDLRSKQDGGKFLGMVFKDKTGDIGGILWNSAAEVARVFELGDVVNLKGRVTSYQGRLQVRVEEVLPLKEGEYNVDDLVQAAVDSSQDVAKFKEIMDTVKHPMLKKLVDAFWADADFMKIFGTAAAAKKWHHEYRGGLARHCYEMARMADVMSDLYPNMDRDILLCGVLLHDLGKISEMRHDLFVDYTDAGKLVGHLQIGVDMLHEKCRDIEGFPEGLRLHLVHCILSHHGELKNGSPVLPKTLEAVVLHHIDNLDAQAAAFTRIVKETQERGQDWSDYQPLIERVIWTKTE